MKESVLISKIVFDQLSKKGAKTNVPPPLHKDVIPLDIKTVPDKKSMNPPLNHLPALTLPSGKTPYAHELIEYIRKLGNLSWDREGNLFPPFHEINIIDLIKELTDKRYTSKLHSKPQMNLLLKNINIPPSMIKNDDIRQAYMSGGGLKKKKKQTTKGRKNKQSVQLNSWVRY